MWSIFVYWFTNLDFDDTLPQLTFPWIIILEEVLLMTIKIVTDSTADLSPELIKELGITVVPLYVCFGKDVYRDREEIN